jgi:hypothetical protein
MPQRFEYEWDEFQVTTGAHAAKARRAIRERGEQGWRCHTVDFSGHPYFQVMWERDVTWRPSQHDSDGQDPGEQPQ